MDFCLLTSTTYGTWLPGDPRGSVTSVRDYRTSDPATHSRIQHNRPGEPWEQGLTGLHTSALRLLKRPPVLLDIEQARLVIEQFRETAAFRGWRLVAVSVMRNHFHAIVGKPETVRLGRVLGDLKAYASRALSLEAGSRQEWWTHEGSKRILPDDRAVRSAVNYVLYKQPHPLARWSEVEGYLP
jgi:REP element-mobilizing transposase RayT